MSQDGSRCNVQNILIKINKCTYLCFPYIFDPIGRHFNDVIFQRSIRCRRAGPSQNDIGTRLADFVNTWFGRHCGHSGGFCIMCAIKNHTFFCFQIDGKFIGCEGL